MSAATYAAGAIDIVRFDAARPFRHLPLPRDHEELVVEWPACVRFLLPCQAGQVRITESAGPGALVYRSVRGRQEELVSARGALHEWFPGQQGNATTWTRVEFKDGAGFVVRDRCRKLRPLGNLKIARLSRRTFEITTCIESPDPERLALLTELEAKRQAAEARRRDHAEQARKARDQMKCWPRTAADFRGEIPGDVQFFERFLVGRMSRIGVGFKVVQGDLNRFQALLHELNALAAGATIAFDADKRLRAVREVLGDDADPGEWMPAGPRLRVIRSS